MKISKVLGTDGASFIGSHLVDMLLSEDLKYGIDVCFKQLIFLIKR